MKSSFFLTAFLSGLTVFAAPAPAPAPAAAPEPYVVTSYIEISTYTYRGLTRSYTTYPESLQTYTNEVLPPATITNAITTITQSDYYDPQVTIVNVVLPAGVGSSSTYDYADYSRSYTSTKYVLPYTFTPRASCTGQNWTFVTDLPITVPSIIRSLITPVTIKPSATTWTNYNDRITRTTNYLAVLNPTDVAQDDLAYALSYAEPYGLSRCYTPTTTCYTYPSETCTPTFAYDYGSGSSSSSGGRYNDYYGYGYDNYIVPLILICVLVPVGWFILWFIIGLWESWMSFKGLMLGKQRKRGLPYSWCCISWLFLCWVGPTYKAKSAEEQVVLADRWKELKAGEKFKLWLKWGLRWKYPDVLGEAPEMDKRPFRQRCL